MCPHTLFVAFKSKGAPDEVQKGFQHPRFMGTMNGSRVSV